jgi:hypothetical protein
VNPIQEARAPAATSQDRALAPIVRNRLLRGQQAAVADASRVFVLGVQNREGNQALPGQDPTLGRPLRRPATGHSRTS